MFVGNRIVTDAPKKRWPNAVVPWEYDSANTFTPAQKTVIEEANPHDLVYTGYNHERDGSMGRR